MKIERYVLFEKKKVKKKSEKEAVEDKFKKEKERIKKKREELTEINQSDDSTILKGAKSKLKRIEIKIVEKELEIAEFRDKKIQYDKDLKDARDKDKEDKKKKKEK